MKRLFFALVLLLLCLWSAAALASSYSVPQADFHYVVNKDGTVNVTERWVVSYESGDFSRFTKDIVLNAGGGWISVVSDLQVAIDGHPCSKSTYISAASQRPNYGYYLGSATTQGSVTTREMGAYLHVSSPSQHEYVFSYTLDDVLLYGKE